LHAWHVPPHAVAQQTPCAQTFDWQSVSAVHAVPFENLPHLPPPHGFGLTHSAAVVHDVRQAVAPQLYGVHDDCVPGWQRPEPLHVGADVNVEPEQVVAPQVVPAA
jgi:hypothetical protein